MKHLLRATSALALLAFAAPALPCGDKATTASSEKSATSEKKQPVAKSDAKKSTSKEKAAAPAKAATN
ncbi:MAG TPA: hypothetical protein VEM76_18925 [Anaeromyxobacteraceae bacterium]|nr:hypothetical protein [Anaeromyxobacteraceae bacterium]